MRSSRENITGWIGSILFHTVLFLVLLLVNVPETIPQSEFVEIRWGAATGVVQAASIQATPQSGEGSAGSSQLADVSTASQVVAPPERRLPDLSDDVLRVPRTDKITSSEATERVPRVVDAKAAGERESAKARALGEKETRISDATMGNQTVRVQGSGDLGTAAGGIEQGISFSVQWLGGGTRKKISGDLPRYPEGVNVEAQIRILAVVLPGGSVKVVQPALKGNTKQES